MHIPNSTPPHGNETVLMVGNVTNATKAIILIHGRGATAEDIISISNHIDLPDNLLVLAPQAANNVWYPARFIVPQKDNRPDLDSALERINTIILYLETELKVTTENIAIAGFSQGACLTAEFLKRNPTRYLAAAIFSGGLIGDEEEVNQTIRGSLAGTPIYLGCDENDFHIPAKRVQTTAEYFTVHGANITLRLYSGLGHSIHSEGLEFLKLSLKQGAS